MSNPRSYPAPEISPEAKGFWDAANDERLVLATCLRCGRAHHFPRAVCPHCHATTLEFRAIDPRGEIYSFSVVGAGDDRYAIAYVTVAGGVKMMTNIVDCDFDALTIGKEVHAVYVPSQTGQKLVMFTPC
ncbi:Zn-ribbon domain-containing OB-fold protein [Aquibium oceanicum]|uniref:DNA-binding protein n=1 Tax=Aquibium oceanicum TaxID=1670800 RepID=A0A1L3SWK8_9HYPH|nr:zinc ribbon domain-containing protein [Aquibium oceanicum]APH73731.1 hypothetical protein BSQ44_21885 [Aquibium oceanicum]